LAPLSPASGAANKRKGTWRLIDGDYHEFTNPVSNHVIADPDIQLIDGEYHLTYTNGAGIAVKKNSRLENVGMGTYKQIWHKSEHPDVGGHVWASEIEWTNNRWYVYACGQNLTIDNTNPDAYLAKRQFNFVLEGTLGERDIHQSNFTFKGWIGEIGIDPNIFKHNGKSYFLYSRYEKNLWGTIVPAYQTIWIAEMQNPYALKPGTATRIVEPQYAWENHDNGAKINEGPNLIKRGNRLLLFYSANSFMNDSYCVGLSTLKINGNLLNPNDWVKHNQPVFERTPDIYGPAGACFVESKDGTELWMAYHARLEQFNVDKKRFLFLHKTQWNGNFPDFGEPYIINKEKVRAPSTDFGKVVIQSYNYPSKHINHVPAGQSSIKSTNDLTNRLFKQYHVYYNHNLEKSIKFGLASSENEIFLQHYSGIIYFWPIDEKPNSLLNASFYEVDGWFGNGTVSYRSKNFPNTYLRHYANKMIIEYTTNASPNLHKKDVSWKSIIMNNFSARIAPGETISNFNNKKQIASSSLNTDLSIHPNPFTDQSIIQFNQFVINTPVTIFVTDMMGKRVATLLDNEQIHKGTHQLIFDGSDLSAGMYYCTLMSGDMVKTQKMMIMK